MSKRNSLGNTSGANTLFKYFTKSPAQSPRTPQQIGNTASVSNNSTTPKSSFSKDKSIDRTKKKNADDDDDDSSIRSVKPKRLKLIDSDSDSDAHRENESDNIQSAKRAPQKKLARPAASEPTTPQPKKKMKMERKKTDDMSFEDKLKAMEVQDIHDAEEKLDEIDDEPVLNMHNKLDFLKPENIKDINGHKPDHPEYDSRTLLVPKAFLDKLTPVK